MLFNNLTIRVFRRNYCIWKSFFFLRPRSLSLDHVYLFLAKWDDTGASTKTLSSSLRQRSPFLPGSSISPLCNFLPLCPIPINTCWRYITFERLTSSIAAILLLNVALNARLSVFFVFSSHHPVCQKQKVHCLNIFKITQNVKRSDSVSVVNEYVYYNHKTVINM